MSESIPAGTIIQYRKVGTFRIIGRTAGTEHLAEQFGLSGRYDLEAVKAPKKYRDQPPVGGFGYWVDPKDIVG